MTKHKPSIHSPVSPIGGARTSPELVSVELKIKEQDIAEMEYHLNECPMSNLAKNNAVTYALRRAVRPGLDVSVSVTRGLALAKIGQYRCALGQNITSWLGRVLMGWDMPPFSATIQIPKDVLRSPFASSRTRTTNPLNGHAESDRHRQLAAEL